MSCADDAHLWLSQGCPRLWQTLVSRRVAVGQCRWSVPLVDAWAGWPGRVVRERVRRLPAPRVGAHRPSRLWDWPSGHRGSRCPVVFHGRPGGTGWGGTVRCHCAPEVPPLLDGWWWGGGHRRSALPVALRCPLAWPAGGGGRSVGFRPACALGEPPAVTSGWAGPVSAGTTPFGAYLFCIHSVFLLLRFLAARGTGHTYFGGRLPSKQETREKGLPST